MGHSQIQKHRRKRKEGAFARACDTASDPVLYGILLLSPWFFGASSRLAAGGFACAAIIFGSLQFLRLRTSQSAPQVSKPVRVLGWLNAALLMYVAISVANARAVFNYDELAFHYRDNISWLPASYHQPATLNRLLQLTGLTALFWGLRAWLLRASSSGEWALNEKRLKRLMWALAINATVMTAIAFAQRGLRATEILWTFPSKWGSRVAFFGPFPYRGNAAQYLNLVWPMVLGFYLYLNRAAGPTRRDGPHLLAIPLSVVALAGAIGSLSRGGALAAGVMALALVVWVSWKVNWRRALAGLGAAMLVLVVGALLAGPHLLSRFRESDVTLSGRAPLYENALKMLKDFPLFGVGQGSFGPVYYTYRESFDQLWQAYAHNDWLEALVCTGIVGFTLQLALLTTVLYCGFRKAAPSETEPLSIGIAVALLGCGLQAAFDFPFQIYGIVLLFTAGCAILTALNFPPTGHSPRMDLK